MKSPLTTRREFLKAGAAAALSGGGVRPAAAADSSRLALVVGNNAYRDAPLGNAVNDAKAVGALLDLAGFTVTLKTDVNRDALREAASTFAAAARRDDGDLLLRRARRPAEWRNYLLPVDARVAG
jgi:uncharacterized caspase-like protein